MRRFEERVSVNKKIIFAVRLPQVTGLVQAVTELCSLKFSLMHLSLELKLRRGVKCFPGKVCVKNQAVK